MKLHIKSKLLSLHDRMEVLDENDNLVYEVSSKMLSIKDKTYIKDADDNDIAYIYAKVLSLHNVHVAEMSDGTTFELSEELMHLTKDIINIEELGLQVHGDILAHNYEIYDEDGNILATTHRKWISLHNVYYLDIVDEERVDQLVTIFVILEHMISKREAVNIGKNPSTQDN